MNNIILFVCTITLASGCNILTEEGNKVRTSPTDSVASTIVITNSFEQRDTSNVKGFKESALENADTISAGGTALPDWRSLSDSDKRYIDWIIPDYPDVILLHEGSAETLNYTHQVRAYLRLKHASVTVKPIKRSSKSTPRDKRLHIADVGENWYELYIFDDWQ